MAGLGTGTTNNINLLYIHMSIYLFPNLIRYKCLMFIEMVHYGLIREERYAAYFINHYQFYLEMICTEITSVYLILKMQILNQ